MSTIEPLIVAIRVPSVVLLRATHLYRGWSLWNMPERSRGVVLVTTAFQDGMSGLAVESPGSLANAMMLADPEGGSGPRTMDPMTGSLDLRPALDHPELLAAPVATALRGLGAAASAVDVAPIDASLADTAAFCETYGVGLDISANCVVIAGRRGEETRYAACVVLATTRADVNGVVRRLLDARKASFAPMDDAVRLTGMEYGGITPIGLPADWALYVDARIPELPRAIVGSGIRASKIELPGSVLAALPNAQVIEGLAR
jgi:prolyl-tRNA editing enzyme YbaK/EbsC (Cys-tRNA(Pro) deacylase)